MFRLNIENPLFNGHLQMTWNAFLSKEK